MHNTKDTYSALHVLYTFTNGQFYILPSLETCEGLNAFYGERFYYNTYTGMCLTSDLQVDPYAHQSHLQEIIQCHRYDILVLWYYVNGYYNPQ